MVPTAIRAAAPHPAPAPRTIAASPARGTRSSPLRRTLVVSCAAAVLVAAMCATALAVTKNGNSGPNTLVGSPGADTLNGFGSADTLLGLGGADRIDSGGGNDTAHGDICTLTGSDADYYCLPGGGPGNDR